MTTRRELVRRLEAAVGREWVIWRREDLSTYEFDGTIEKQTPYAVVLPATPEEIAAVVRIARELGFAITPRGAGTGLSGGAVAAKRGVVIGTARMKRIIEIDPVDRIAVVEPGLPNIQLSEAAAKYGLFYAPDPSSQRACTIGGNVAENAGGPHCLALGVTTNHVLGIEIVTAEGAIEWLGGRVAETAGYDLRGAFVGSEGTLGIVTKVIVRLLPAPAEVATLLASFATVEQASATVSAAISAGMVPAAMEIMDRLTIQAVEASLKAGYPPDAGAVLLVELDGLPEVVSGQVTAVRAACLENGAVDVRLARDAAERTTLWRGRKEAIGSLGHIAPNYYIVDGVVPRSKLVDVIGRVGEISRSSGFPVANVFHAGDGNLHPLILFDERVPGATERVLDAAAAIMEICVAAGGSLSGEHGVGFEKQRFMPWLYGEADLENMERIRAVFGNDGLFNPCKILPEGTGCGEMGHNAAALRNAGPESYV